MWRSVLLCLCLTLSDCTGSAVTRAAPGAEGPSPVVTADSTILRRLIGEDVLDKPLLPQPGNIWADVLPATQPGLSAATPASRDSGHRPVAAVAPSAGSPRLAAPVVAAAAPATVSARAAVRPATAPTAAAAHTSATALIAAPAASPAAAVTPAAAPNAGAFPPAVLRAATRLVVQLAAADSAQRAEAEWRRLRQHAPTLTNGHLPAVSEAEVNGQHVWRLRAAGFADVAEASAFCTGIRAVKANCWVVPPSASP